VLRVIDSTLVRSAEPPAKVLEEPHGLLLRTRESDADQLAPRAVRSWAVLGSRALWVGEDLGHGNAPGQTGRINRCCIVVRAVKGDHLDVAELWFPVPPLAGDVVLLRPWREADVPGLVAAFSDPVMRRFSWRTAPYTETDARGYVAEQEGARVRGDALHFALAGAHDRDVLLGAVWLQEVRLDQGCAAVGYWLAPGARGRGAAAQAVRLLARWAFAGLGLARLELTCGPDNEASQHVAERCGFSREGLLRSHVPFQGARRDSVIYGLLPGELR
jgi:RimJ/RimL family protein N-acetyltransferase